MKKNEKMDWDLGGDTSPQGGPPPVPGKKGIRVVKINGSRPPGYLPGVNDPNSPKRPGYQKPLFKMNGEGASAGSALIGYQAPEREDETPNPRQRLNRQTTQMQVPADVPAPSQGRSWDITVPGKGIYRITGETAADAETAKQEFAKWWSSPEGEGPGQQLDVGRLQIAPTQEALAALRSVIERKVQEIVRKKVGGGGYNLYPPNKGKKNKKQKSVGTFPTRLAAKKAELARFPPKDPEQLKRTRARLDKLSKDPKKRIEKEKEDLTGGKKTKHSGAPARDRKKVKEDIVRRLVGQLSERLFSDEEVPGSPWDERINSMHPDALSSDKRLHLLHRGLEKASIGALGDAHKGLARSLRGMARVTPGDHAFDPERKKMFLPVTLDVDGTEVGPVHLYVDGGHVKVELSGDVRQQIAALDSDKARDLRGGLMTFQEDHLPEIDKAKRAWDERDGYLDKLHGRLERQFGRMSGVEHHLAKGILNKRKPGK